MRFFLLAAATSLLVFVAANAAASGLLMLHWRARRAAWMRRSASSLFACRCLPAALSGSLALLTVLPAFVLHEPPNDVEPITLPLGLGAAAGLLILAAAAGRGIAAIRTTRRSLGRWLRSARPARVPGWSGRAWLVDPDAAGVCVVGFRRPVLLVSRSVVETCTSGELSGVVAHERAHAASGDNWKRLILRCAPDVLGMTPIAGRLERVWLARAEEEADAAAVRADRTLGVEIAGALVKLARRQACPGLPLATSFEASGPLERRVRRLLADLPPARNARRSWWAILFMALAGALILGTLPPFSRGIHQMIEVLVKALA